MRAARDHRGAARPGAARPAVGRPARGLAGRPPGRPAPRHLAARRALRPARPAGSSRSRRSARRSPTASTSCCACCAGSTCPCGRAGRRRHRPRRPRRRAPRGRAGHPAPAVLAALPRAVQPDPAARHRAPGCVDALAVLLVRLHLTGFFWGDVLAVEHAVPPGRRRVRRLPGRRRDRRPARRSSRDGQRELRPRARADQHRRRADGPRGRRAAATTVDRRGRDRPTRSSQRYRCAVGRAHRARVVRAAATGWRVERGSGGSTSSASTSASSTITTDIDGTTVRIQPKVVDAGHHSRRLLRLTGLDVEENQARRLLNDLDAYRAAKDRQGEDEEIVAHDWLTQVFEPVVRAVPARAARQARAGRGVPRGARAPLVPVRAAGPRRRRCPRPCADYLQHVLPRKPDEVRGPRRRHPRAAGHRPPDHVE